MGFSAYYVDFGLLYYFFLLDIPLLHVGRYPWGLQTQDAIRSLTIVYFFFRIYRLAHKGLCYHRHGRSKSQ